ncbi:MAG: putative sugar kinase [Clostridia bacterium]|jgi:NAD+ kinase|nr:putative sugar kinase [Clostridia bacterium]
MNIGIISNLEKDESLKITKDIIDWFEKREINVFYNDQISAELSLIEARYCNDDLFTKSDIIVVLGGDGTLLNVARQASCTQAPLFGINLGHLGFLTEIEVNDMYSAFERLIKGEYSIEKRIMLEAFVENDDSFTRNFIALNDIVITKGNFSRLVTYSIYINDKYVDLLSADGLVVSSPTGSTAYSLSAGGPIVAPDVDALIVTPICPHTLHSRPIIVSSNDMVRIAVSRSNNTNVMMTVDGQDGVMLKPGDIVSVKKSRYYANLVKLKDKNFFDILRQKMSERWDNKNK